MTIAQFSDFIRYMAAETARYETSVGNVLKEASAQNAENTLYEGKGLIIHINSVRYAFARNPFSHNLATSQIAQFYENTSRLIVNIGTLNHRLQDFIWHLPRRHIGNC